MAAFDGKVVWMTGAGTGIGRAGALDLRRHLLELVAAAADAASSSRSTSPTGDACRRLQRGFSKT